MKIHLLPSDHVFECDDHEFLLDAALGSGLSVAYGCNNGNCGECLARIVEGQVNECRHANYVFTQQQKNNNYLLMCCCKPSSDMRLEVGELAIEDIPEQRIDTKVTKISSLSKTIMEVELRTPRSKNMTFMAGQAVKFQCADTLSAAYSVSSCPCNGMMLRFHIPRTEESFSKLVFSELKKNQKITI